jgi:hypothetical protein
LIWPLDLDWTAQFPLASKIKIDFCGTLDKEVHLLKCSQVVFSGPQEGNYNFYGVELGDYLQARSSRDLFSTKTLAFQKGKKREMERVSTTARKIIWRSTGSIQDVTMGEIKFEN